MAYFKDKAINAIIDHLPNKEDGTLIEDSWKINITRSNEVRNRISKNTITIEWDEYMHPCKGCPGFDHLDDKEE